MDQTDKIRMRLVCRKIISAFAPIFLLTLSFLIAFPVFGQQFLPDLPPKYLPDTRIDNMGYWRWMAELGLVAVQPAKPVPPALQRTSKMVAPGTSTYDSPDIPVTETNTLQSENSIFVDPENADNLLNSNNSHPAPYIGTQFGADALLSPDNGATWEGTIEGAGGYNLGDPTTAISRSGRMFVGYIFSGGGQGVSYSDDHGQSWHKRGVASAPPGIGSMLDKNHLWIDNSLTSPYMGTLYDAWTVFGGNGTGYIEVSRSTDGGMAWQIPSKISNAVQAGSHNQGINLQTGPLGEVYAVWAIYDNWPADEKALGFARSINGGQTWQPAKRIINNIRGIRTSGVSKMMRVNSFPCMVVDVSNGPNRGNIYVVWANINEPGINTGNGVDIYMIKSTDQGDTWGNPVKVNQDESGMNKQHYLPWITCDPENGNLSVVFYDDRNVSDTLCETWVAISKNGGLSWQDFRVSDVAFTPVPLTGLSDNYFGDYLGITSKGGMVYPCWTDNRSGQAMGWVSPFRLGPLPGQAFIDYYTHMVNDSISGNNNGEAEFSETFSLMLTMKNIGDQPDTAVNVTLTCETPFVQVINNTQVFGDFGTGQMKSVPEAFQIRLSDSIANNLELVFTLHATDNHDSTFNSNFIIRSHSPQLSIGPMIVFDTAGNGNGQPDPGETIVLASILSNTGDYFIPSSKSVLFTMQPFCHIAEPVEITNGIAPGNSDTVFWQVQVDPDVPAGTAAAFVDSLSYSGQEFYKTFVKKIGVLTEDWESGNFSKMAWVQGGDKSWQPNNFKVYEGLYSVRSGYISDLETSTFSITLNLVANDSISFYRKVSSELNYDFLNFYIDNALVGKWSGEKDWARVAFPVPAGIHQLKWEYVKDLGIDYSYDAAWVDFIEFPVQQRTTVDAGADARICTGSTFVPSAMATNYQTLTWSTSGTGIFNDPTIFSPTYFPSISDIEAGSIQLFLTLTGFSYGETVCDTLVLSFAPKPTLNAGVDTYTCIGEVFHSSASATNYESLHWSTLGDGSFTNPDTLVTGYSPGPLETHYGLTKLVLHLEPDTVCAQLTDTLLLHIYPMPGGLFTGDTTICMGDTAFLKLKLTGQGPWRVYLSDGSIFSFRKPSLLIPVSPASSTTYEVDSISNASGCTFRSVLKVTVTVLHLPEIVMQGPVESCPGRQVIIQATADSAASYQWLPGGAATSFINPIVSGNIGEIRQFDVQVTGLNGCRATDSLLVRLVNDCKDTRAGNLDVRWFPNPSDGNFTLMLSSATNETAGISLSSMDNKLIYSVENLNVLGVKTLELHLNSLAQGTYLLSIKCNSGELKDKLVVKK